MNPIIVISLLYSPISLGMICILFFSFKGRVDSSGRLFLEAELLMLVTVAIQTWLTLNPDYKQPLFYLIGNGSYFAAEISIAFSIYTLTHEVSLRHYLLVLGMGLVYCLGMEHGRALNSHLPQLLAPIAHICLQTWTCALCLRVRNPTLRTNVFLKWFGYLEIALICLNALRVAAYFSGNYVTPLNADVFGLVVYLSRAVIHIFCYMAYQAVRMTWVPDTSRSNVLNSHLARSLQDNQQLVSGLMRSNRLLGVGALASSLAHQLSQPLTGAALETESIKRDLAQPGHEQAALASLDKVSSQLGKLSQLVRSLRKLFGDKDTAFRAFALADACDEVLALAAPTTTARKITVQTVYNANPQVLGDPIQVQQVLINLLNNAIEVLTADTCELKQITLRIDVADGFAILQVEDNGPGITEALLPTVFELYKTTKQDGVGVGLWLSQTIVNRHHGKITAANKTDGGAVFTVRLPLAEVAS